MQFGNRITDIISKPVYSNFKLKDNVGIPFPRKLFIGEHLRTFFLILIQLFSPSSSKI